MRERSPHPLPPSPATEPEASDDNDGLLLRVNFRLNERVVPTGIETAAATLVEIARGVVTKSLRQPITAAGEAAAPAAACDPSTIQRVFRDAGKNEHKHRAARLHMHMYIDCPSRVAASVLVDELSARRHDVSSSGRVPRARKAQVDAYPIDPLYPDQTHYKGSPIDMAAVWALEKG